MHTAKITTEQKKNQYTNNAQNMKSMSKYHPEHQTNSNSSLNRYTRTKSVERKKNTIILFQSSALRTITENPQIYEKGEGNGRRRLKSNLRLSFKECGTWKKPLPKRSQDALTMVLQTASRLKRDCCVECSMGETEKWKLDKENEEEEHRDGKRAGPAHSSHRPKWAEPFRPISIWANCYQAQPGPTWAADQNGPNEPKYQKYYIYIYIS